MFERTSVTLTAARGFRGTRSARAAMLAAALLALPATVASAGELAIAVENIGNSEGHLRVALYREGSQFLKQGQEEAATFRNAAPGTMVFAFPDLAAGRYGIAVFHDANANGELDSNLLGIPTEGIGFSNAAKANFGPPTFADVAVTVPDEGTVTTRAPLTY
ncbi:MAG: DUF2141 domain-containing protein [Minwuia sp.]|nr:DUF2141 domain-containing protein [Minwuia sp.]